MNEDKIIESAIAQVSNRFAIQTQKDLTVITFMSGGGDNAILVAKVAISAENMKDFAPLISKDADKRKELVIPQTLAAGTANSNLQGNG